MRHFLAALTIMAVATSAHAQIRTTRGYVKQDGTYVAPHYSTKPNATKTDNWSSTPNVNPYTGKAGTKNPYAPTYNSPYKPKKCC
jgi:hypothetical protein